MPRKFFVCIVLSLIGWSLPAPASAQGFKWWQNDRFQKELSLTTEQVGRLEEIFQGLQSTLRAQKDALDSLESKLTKVINDSTADEVKVLSVVERVEASRAELSKTRTLMIFRMRRILTEDQNVKMKALHEQWERERRTRSSPRNHARR
jgi:Spy/CpxP family protein refolding chaperone